MPQKTTANESRPAEAKEARGEAGREEARREEAAEKKPAEKKADEKKKESGGTCLLLERPSPFMLTAFAADEKPKSAEATKGLAGEKPTKVPEDQGSKGPEKPAKPTEAKEAKAPEKPAKAPEAEETKAPGTLAKPTETKEAKVPAKPATKAAAAPVEAKKAGAAKTGPSDQIKSFIRQQIVGEGLQRAFQALSEQIDHYRSALGKYEAAKGKATTVAEPPKLDLAALARQARTNARHAGRSYRATPA